MKNLAKTLFLGIVFSLLILETACAKPQLKVRIIKNVQNTDLNQTWNFTDGKSFFAMDKDTLQVLVHLEFDTFVSSPQIYKDKLYLGDQGKVPGDFGKGLFVLNKKFKLEKTIPTLRNIRKIGLFNDILVTDSLCIYRDGKSGFSLTDGEQNNKIYTSTSEPGIICNEGDNWSYGKRLILGYNEKTENPRIISYSLDKTNENIKIKKEELFNEELQKLKGTANIIVNENLVIINLRNANKIVIFDLDKNQKVNEIDLSKFIKVPGFDASDSEDWILNRKPYFANGCYYLLICNFNQQKENRINKILKYDIAKDETSFMDIECNARTIRDYMIHKDKVYIRSGTQIDVLDTSFFML